MRQQIRPSAEPSPGRPSAKAGGGHDPVREYVGDFAEQLALMAREAGDEALAKALEASKALAMRPLAHPVMVTGSLKRRA